MRRKTRRCGLTKDRKRLMPPKLLGNEKDFHLQFLCYFNTSNNFQYHRGIYQHLYYYFYIVVSHKNIINFLILDSQIKI